MVVSGGEGGIGGGEEGGAGGGGGGGGGTAECTKFPNGDEATKLGIGGRGILKGP